MNQTHIDQIYRWPLGADGVINLEYSMPDESLNRLYLKSQVQQWKIDDYDWTYTLDPDNPLDMPDATLPVFGSKLWLDMDEKNRGELRRHFHSWTLSQILHGEQAAMVGAMKLAQQEESLSARLCAAAQAFDEARHIEVYSRLVNQKIGFSYPLSGSLRQLLQTTLTSSHVDITNLGIQILVEGIALAIFQNVVAYSRDQFIKEIVGKIQRDESRHVAIGRIMLRKLYRGELSGAEMRVREDFLCEGLQVLYEHLCADDIWESAGMNKKDCAELMRSSNVANALRRNLFRRLIPSVKDLGLLTPKVAAYLESVGMLDYASLPLRTEEV